MSTNRAHRSVALVLIRSHQTWHRLRRRFVDSTYGPALVVVIALVGGLGISLAQASALNSALPGVEALPQELEALQAAACGQFCSTHGNANCVGSTICLLGGGPTPSCASPGINCEACEGSQHITCQGNTGSADLCQERSISCCMGALSCQNTGNINNPCMCLPGAPNAASGFRIVCSVSPNHPSCQEL